MDINEKFYKQATEEYNSDVIDDSIMSKSLSLSGGDEEKAKWKYIELRAERLSEDSSINVKEEEEEESSPIKSFLSIFSDDEDKKKKEEEEEKKKKEEEEKKKEEEEKKKEEEEKKGTSGWKIFFIIIFFPITIPYYLIKNGFFIFCWCSDD